MPEGRNFRERLAIALMALKGSSSRLPLLSGVERSWTNGLNNDTILFISIWKERNIKRPDLL